MVQYIQVYYSAAYPYIRICIFDCGKSVKIKKTSKKQLGIDIKQKRRQKAS